MQLQRQPTMNIGCINHACFEMSSSLTDQWCLEWLLFAWCLFYCTLLWEHLGGRDGSLILDSTHHALPDHYAHIDKAISLFVETSSLSILCYEDNFMAPGLLRLPRAILTGLPIHYRFPPAHLLYASSLSTFSVSPSSCSSPRKRARTQSLPNPPTHQ